MNEMMHNRAVWRLSTLLLLSAGCFSLSAKAMGVLSAGLLLWAAMAGDGLVALWWQRVWRLKWFFLAIFVLYLFGGYSQIGQADWPMAVYRVSVLIALVGIVVICLQPMAPFEVASGLNQILHPLQRLGFNVDAFSRRLALTLDAVAHMQTTVRGLGRDSQFQALADVCQTAESYQPATVTDHALIRGETRDYLLAAVALTAVLGLQFI